MGYIKRLDLAILAKGTAGGLGKEPGITKDLQLKDFRYGNYC